MRSRAPERTGAPVAEAGNAPRTHAGSLVLGFEVALVAATLMYLVSAGGLLHFAPLVQIGLLVGAVAGSLAPNASLAAGAAGGAFAAGVACGAPRQLDVSQSSVAGVPVMVLAGVAGAVAVSMAVRRRHVSEWMVAGALVAVLVVNALATTIALDSKPWLWKQTLVQRIQASGKVVTDDDLYREVRLRVRSGDAYYVSVRTLFRSNPRWHGDPPSAVSYRSPLMFAIWAVLPGDGWGVIALGMLFAVAAGVLTLWLGSMAVSPVLAVPAVAAVEAYLLPFNTTTRILYTEQYAVVLALASVAAMIHAAGREGRRAVVWVAVAASLAAAATVIRELMVFVLIAGLVASVVRRSPSRRSRVAAWCAASAVTAAYYSFHLSLARSAGVAGQSAQAWVRPGLAHLLLALQWSDPCLSITGALLPLLAALGLTGALAVRDRPLRLFLAATCVVPLIAFTLFFSGGTMPDGSSVNYWGTIVMPILIALGPWAFSRLPAAYVGPRFAPALAEPVAAVSAKADE